MTALLEWSVLLGWVKGLELLDWLPHTVLPVLLELFVSLTVADVPVVPEFVLGMTSHVVLLLTKRRLDLIRRPPPRPGSLSVPGAPSSRGGTVTSTFGMLSIPRCREPEPGCIAPGITGVETHRAIISKGLPEFPTPRLWPPLGGAVTSLLGGADDVFPGRIFLNFFRNEDLLCWGLGGVAVLIISGSELHLSSLAL